MFYCSFFYYICIVNNLLLQLGNIPVTATALESLFPNIKGSHQKIRLLERDKHNKFNDIVVGNILKQAKNI